MFWGCILKIEQQFVVKSKIDKIIHLSKATLGRNTKDNNKYIIQLLKGDEKFDLCVLQKDKAENIQLDHYLKLGVGNKYTLNVISNGKNSTAEVHITGYYEAENHNPDDEVNQAIDNHAIKAGNKLAPQEDDEEEWEGEDEEENEMEEKEEEEDEEENEEEEEDDDDHEFERDLDEELMEEIEAEKNSRSNSRKVSEDKISRKISEDKNSRKVSEDKNSRKVSEDKKNGKLHKKSVDSEEEDIELDEEDSDFDNDELMKLLQKKRAEPVSKVSKPTKLQKVDVNKKQQRK